MEGVDDSVRRETLYNILIEFGIPKKRVRLIKMCLTETYSRVWMGKNLSEMFPIRNGLKQGDAFSPLLFNFAMEYAIKRVQVNQDGLKLNGKHQLLAYADDVNILGGSAHTVKENAEALLVVTKEIGQKKMLIKLSTWLCLGIGMQGGVTDQYSIQEEIKSSLKLGNACYYSVQNRLSSSFLSKTLKDQDI